jgi:tetratricopeptide (TPR) repeat protein
MGTTRMSSCSAAAGAVLLAGCPQQTDPVDVLTETSMTEILEEAQAKFDAHQYTDALAMYKWAIERDPDNAEYHYLAGMCLLLTEQYEKGEYYFRTALARAPGMMAACRGLAMCLSGEGKVREATSRPPWRRTPRPCAWPRTAPRRTCSWACFTRPSAASTRRWRRCAWPRS